MVAAKYNRIPGILTKLVALGADLEKENNFGKTALEIAIRDKNQIAVIELTALKILPQKKAKEVLETVN